MKTQQIVLASRPNGAVSITNFRAENVKISKIKVGEVLLIGLFYSVDPYMQDRINNSESTTTAFQIDEPIEGGVLARVLESKSDLFATDDIVLGMLPWKEQIITSDKSLQKIDTSITSENYYLGILGMSGRIPYFGLMYVGDPKMEQTIRVDEPTLADLKSGSKKSTLLKEKFGFDESINYKSTADLKNAIADLCPDDVDIYFDNVGGEISDAVISSIDFNSRLALCGQISLNTTENSVKCKENSLLPDRSVTMQGFIIGNYQTSFFDDRKVSSYPTRNQKLKFKEKIVSGFEKLPSALLGLFNVQNKRKFTIQT